MIHVTRPLRARVEQLHVVTLESTSRSSRNNLDQKSDHPKISKNHHPTRLSAESLIQVFFVNLSSRGFG